MLVSILVPIYNVENFLEKCLDSIFHQTYTDLEYVFVNDCTPDHSMDILERYIETHNIDKCRVKIISHEQNLGIAITRCDCIVNATGEYVLFVDSDDWIEHDMVEQMVLATHNASIDIVGCDFVYDYAVEKSCVHKQNYAKSCYDNMLRAMNFEIMPALWNFLTKKELYDFFVINPTINVGEDYIISVKLFYYAKTFVAVHKPLYHYIQSNSVSLSSQKVRCLNDHIRAVQEVDDFFKNKGIMNQDINHQLLLRKFNIKSNFLTARFLDYNKYINCFPEADGMWRFINYTKREKLKFWLAEKRLFFILKILQH